MMLKIAYVGGYGRSGSTLLDFIISSSSPNALGCGELVYILNDYNTNQKCSCGSLIETCPIWSEAVTSLLPFAGLFNQVSAFEKRNGIFGIFVAPRLKTVEIDLYKSFWKKIFLAAKNYQIVVDSSKTTATSFWRPFLQDRLLKADVRFIHLKRSLLPTIKSALKGQNWHLEGRDVKYRSKPYIVLRTLIGWTLANLQAARMRYLLGADNYFFLRYEDLMTHPEVLIRSLGDFLGTDFTLHAKLVSNGKELFTGNSHNIGGNRLRLKSSIKLKVS